MRACTPAGRLPSSGVFERLARRAAGLLRRPAPLLPLTEVTQRLDVVQQRYVGLRTIPVDRIVGTLDRAHDFHRGFRPRRREQLNRLLALGHAFPDNNFPPITVYEIGGAYFVSDGHHRVALAHERGILALDAEVTRMETSYTLPPDVDVPQLIHMQQHHKFMQRSGLTHRPGAVVKLSCPEGYPELLELIKAHGYDLQRKHNRLIAADEVAADWYDSVYVPGVTAFRQEDVSDAYSDRTDADLFLWMHQQRARLWSPIV